MIDWQQIETVARIITPIIALIVPFLAYLFGLRSERRKRERIVKEITNSLRLEICPLYGGNGVVVNVHNPTIYSIQDASVSITIDNSEEDVLSTDLLDFKVWHQVGEKVTNMQICWSKVVNGRNVGSRTIYPSEKAQLSIGRYKSVESFPIIHQNRIHEIKSRSTKKFSLEDMDFIDTYCTEVDAILFPPEEGFGNDVMAAESKKNGHEIIGGALLVKRHYRFYLHFVSAETTAKFWQCEFTDSEIQPIKVLKNKIKPTITGV